MHVTMDILRMNWQFTPNCRSHRSKSEQRTRHLSSPGRYPIAHASKSQSTEISSLDFLTSIGFQPEEAMPLLASLPAASTTLEELTHVCQTLCNVGIPVSKLKTAILNTPELIATPAQSILERYAVLKTAWPDEHQLRTALARTPSIFSAEYPASLGRCMSTLQELGFSPAQSAYALVTEPSLALVRRYEITTSLKKCGIDLTKTSPKAFQLLSDHPKHCLLPEGSTKLRKVLDVLERYGIPPHHATEIMLYNTKLLTKATVEKVDAVLKKLQCGNMSSSHIDAIVSAYPPILLKDPERIQQALALLQSHNINIDKLIEYPRAFSHDPLRVWGPRFAFLKLHSPESLQKLSLKTILSKSDGEFVQYRVEPHGQFMEEYIVFRINWLVRFQVEEEVSKSDRAESDKNTNDRSNDRSDKGNHQGRHLQKKDPSKERKKNEYTATGSVSSNAPENLKARNSATTTTTSNTTAGDGIIKPSNPKRNYGRWAAYKKRNQKSPLKRVVPGNMNTASGGNDTQAK